MPLFRWTCRGGAGGTSNILPTTDDFANILELELIRDAEENAAAKIRPHMSHPLHEAAMLALPPHLQILRANDCRIRTFPVLPVSIIEVYFERNNILRLPESLTHLTNCIVLELNDNRIEEIDCSTMPPNLARIGMKLNALGSVKGNLPTTCLNWDFMENPSRCVFENGNQYIRQHVAAPIVGRGVATPKNPYTNGQSVHNTSIQTSARNNLAYIVDYRPEVPQKVEAELVVAINAAYRKWWKFGTETWTLPGSMLKTYIDGTYILNGVTIQRLIDRLWLRICDSSAEIRPELMRRFAEEVRDGAGMCSNGMFTRLTNNVLLGFDEHIVVRASNNEILSTRIPCTMTRLRKEMALPADGSADTLEYWQKVYQQTIKDLVEINEGKGTWQSWLETIVDAFGAKLFEDDGIATKLRPLLRERGIDTTELTNAIQKYKMLGFPWEIDILRTFANETVLPTTSTDVKATAPITEE